MPASVRFLDQFEALFSVDRLVYSVAKTEPSLEHGFYVVDTLQVLVAQLEVSEALEFGMNFGAVVAHL